MNVGNINVDAKHSRELADAIKRNARQVVAMLSEGDFRQQQLAGEIHRDPDAVVAVLEAIAAEPERILNEYQRRADLASQAIQQSRQGAGQNGVATMAATMTTEQLVQRAVNSDPAVVKSTHALYIVRFVNDLIAFGKAPQQAIDDTRRGELYLSYVKKYGEDPLADALTPRQWTPETARAHAEQEWDHSLGDSRSCASKKTYVYAREAELLGRTKVCGLNSVKTIAKFDGPTAR